MPVARLTRRASLLLPFALAACGGEPQTFPPLRYDNWVPIRLNVATISIEQRYYPSGVAPDVTSLAPVHPVEALRAMADDRLQALGSAGQAVFAITNASLTKQADVITCSLAVELEIYMAPGIRSGFARAYASRQHTGHIDDLRTTLYDVTKDAMNAMNVEFEYQIRNNLQPWLLSASAAPPPVQQQPLQVGPAEAPPGAPPAPAAPAPPAAPPTPLAPPTHAAPPVSTSPPPSPSPGLPPLPPAQPVPLRP